MNHFMYLDPFLVQLIRGFYEIVLIDYFSNNIYPYYLREF